MDVDHPIILFDGVCNVCHATVRFVLKRDRKARFRFASLQSQAAAAIIDRCGRRNDTLETMLLVKGDRCLDRSTALLHILRQLRFPWPLFSILLIVPRPLRDFLYTAFARRRYRWFGKQESCLRPAPEVRERFLD